MDIELDRKTIEEFEKEFGVKINRINADINIDPENVEESYRRAIEEIRKALRQIHSGEIEGSESFPEDFEQVDLKKLLDNDMEA